MLASPKINIAAALSPNGWNTAICSAFSRMSVLPEEVVLDTPTQVLTIECVQNRSEHSIYRTTWKFNDDIGEYYYVFKQNGSISQYEIGFGFFSQIKTYVFNDNLLEAFEFTPIQDFVFVEVPQKAVDNFFQCGLSEVKFIGKSLDGLSFEFCANHNCQIILYKEGADWKSNRPLSQVSLELVEMMVENIKLNGW